MIKIYTEDKVIENCGSAIIVPEKAITEAGYIQTVTEKNDASSKHEFHAMSQMAYFQFQDDELAIDVVNRAIRIESGQITEELLSGLVLYRDTDGGFHVLVHSGLNTKKLIETAFRFCTRWVRLDI